MTLDEECEKEVDREIKFVSRAKIKRGEIVDIPSEAIAYRLSRGEILFFSGNEDSLNSRFVRIPENTTAIRFPEYEKHVYNIHYGKPVFS